MSLFYKLFPFLMLVIGTIVIWLPYFWPRAGYLYRNILGPWLINFDPHQRKWVIAHDICLTSLWLGVWCVGLWPWPIIVFMVVILVIIALVDNHLDGSDDFDLKNQTKAVTFFSKTSVQLSDLQDFLRSRGALLPNRRRTIRYHARYNYQGGHIWVALTTDQLKFTDQYENAQDQSYSITQSARIQEMLQGEPQTMILIWISRGSGIKEGEALATQEICAMMERWPSVIEPAMGVLLGVDEFYGERKKSIPLFDSQESQC